MSTSHTEKTEPFLSKRRVAIAGVAAFIGCAACCALPLLAAAGLGSGGAAALSSAFRPGSELLVGGGVFAVTLSAMALTSRLRRAQTEGCGTSCKVDGSCCDHGAHARSA